MAKAARALLYCFLLWAPLPLASNRPVFWVVNAAVATLILLLFLGGEIGRNARPDLDWRPVATAATAFLLVVAWMVVQAWPVVPAFLQHPVWRETLGPSSSSGSISISPSSTWTTIAEVLPIGLLGIVAMRLAMDRERAVFLLKVVVIATTAIAIYGLAAQTLGVRQVFLIDSDAYQGFLTGTFVGRNAAATYFVIGIAAATAIIAARIEETLDRRPAHTPGTWAALAAELPRTAGVYVLADLVLAAALLNTGSRGGTIAGGIALVTIALQSMRRTTGGRGTVAATFAAVFGMVFIVVAISSDLLLNRLEQGVGTGDRLAVYRDTLDMIWARPLLGHGAGAFLDAYPLFHVRGSAAFIWNKAHDTYLQSAAELGLPAFALLMAGIAVVLFHTLRGALRREEPKPAAVAAVAVAAATAFHSLVDFSLQVQAVGLTAVVVIGAGLGDSLRRRQRSRISSKPSAGAETAEPFSQLEKTNVVVQAASARRPPPAD